MDSPAMPALTKDAKSSNYQTDGGSAETIYQIGPNAGNDIIAQGGRHSPKDSGPGNKAAPFARCGMAGGSNSRLLTRMGAWADVCNLNHGPL